MADIDRYRPEDRRGVEQLYRRTFGTHAADAFRLRWDWARRNPAIGGGEPPFAVVREGPTIIAVCPVTPVRVSLRGLDSEGAWSSDPLVAAERQRQGLGESLLRTWDRQSGVALGASLSDGTRFLLEKIRWPKPVTLPCLVKPLSRRAFRQPSWPVAINRFVSALALPVSRSWLARGHSAKKSRSCGVSIAASIGSGSASRRGWIWPCGGMRHISTGSSSSRRTCATSVAVLKRDEEPHGYAVYRHLREPQGKVTQIVDFLVDPADERGLTTLLHWIDREARAEDSDKIRCYVQHSRFRRVLRRSGYFVVKSNIVLNAKVNAVQVPNDFYDDPDGWHFTLGDGDLDH